jgi:hypothetical protein
MQSVNSTQFQLLENEERSGSMLTTRLLNNFEALLSLFDNFIFEEEYISIGDEEEQFSSRKDYNFLLKLKANNKSNVNLKSKRNFKKVYCGLDRSQLRIKYIEKFDKLLKELTESILVNKIVMKK